tara:strand:- start:986 stop:1846 length:861 start_codon:yes stop_codon:yes gene_type:complete
MSEAPIEAAVPAPDAASVSENVRAALAEDMGDGDITAALIDATAQAQAQVITREDGVLCGRPWVDAVFKQLDPAIVIEWRHADADVIAAGEVLLRVSGPARALLTGERTALNFLQLLSGTASRCRHYADSVADTRARLLDTRKTIPGLRIAQKYAVRCGGCLNHRIGLFDAFLIKENHIAACGGVQAAIRAARAYAPGKPVEIEVENMAELEEALAARADRVMLDNFSLDALVEAVTLTAGRAELEASGNVTESTLRPIADTGVDFISIGALTKDCKALDLSMRLL